MERDGEGGWEGKGWGGGGERWKRAEEKCSGERSVVGDWGEERERTRTRKLYFTRIVV